MQMGSGKAVWNPAKQQFEGTLPNGKPIQGDRPVNSAGDYWKLQNPGGIRTAGQQYDTDGNPVERGMGAVLIGGDDDYIQKLMDDPNRSDAFKAKLQMRKMAMDEAARRTDQDERESLRRNGIAQRTLDSNLLSDKQERAIKGLTLEQAQEVRDLQIAMGQEADPERRRMMGDRYDTLTGNTGKYQVSVVDTGVPLDPSQPLLGNIKKTIRMNSKTGEIEDLATALPQQGIGR
jgi:hypothetical protein